MVYGVTSGVTSASSSEPSNCLQGAFAAPEQSDALSEPKPSVLNETQPQKLPAEELDRYLEATGKLFGVDANGASLDGGHGGVVGRQLIRLVQGADKRLDEAVEACNQQHPQEPLKAKKLDFVQVALLRTQGFYRPDANTAALLERAGQLHERGLNALKEARHASATGQGAKAREAIATFSQDFRDLRQMHDGYAQTSSDNAHDSVRHWEYAQAGVGVTAGVLVAGAAFTPLGQVMATGAAVGLGDAALSVGVGTMSGLILGVGRRAGEEAGHVAAGQKASVDRFARNVVGDTLSAAGTSLSVAVSAAGVSQLAARAAQAGFGHVGKLAELAMTTRTGEAVSRGAIDAVTDVAGQLFDRATHGLRRDGTEAPEFEWRSVGVSALSGAASGVGGGYIGRMAMSSLKAEARELVRESAEAVMDLSVGSASMVGMNIGTDRSLLGTFEDNLNMVVSSVTTGRVSSALAGRSAPATQPRRLPSGDGGALAGLRGLADMFQVPDFGLVTAGGIDMPVPDLMMTVGGNGNDSGNSNRLGSGKNKEGPGESPTGKSRFYPEGSLDPKDQVEHDVMDDLLEAVKRNVGGREDLALEIMAEFRDMKNTPPKEARQMAERLLDWDNEDEYVDYVDWRLHDLLAKLEEKGEPLPPPTYVEGRFLALGATPPPDDSSHGFDGLFDSKPKPPSLDVALRHLARHLGSESDARLLIEHRFGISARSDADAQRIRPALQWMLDTRTFNYEIDKTLYIAGEPLLDPAHYGGKVPYFEDFSMRPKFGPYLPPDARSPRPGTDDPLTLLQDRLAFDFDGDIGLARTLVGKLLAGHPTQRDLDIARGRAHEMLGDSKSLNRFLLKYLEVMKAPHAREAKDRAEYGRLQQAHVEKTGHAEVMARAREVGARLFEAAEKLLALQNANEPEWNYKGRELAAQMGAKHILCDNMYDIRTITVQPFPDSRFADPKRGQAVWLKDRVGAAGHTKATELLPGGLENVIQDHGGLHMGRGRRVETVVIPRGSALTKDAPGISMSSDLADNLAMSGEQTGGTSMGGSLSFSSMGLAEMNGGFHPHLENWATYLPDAKVVSERHTAPVNLQVRENTSSSGKATGMPYVDILTEGIGHVIGAHCTKIHDSTRLINPMHLHDHPEIYEEGITLPGRQMPNPAVTWVTVDKETGKYRESLPIDKDYVHDWVPAPPTPEERALTFMPRDPRFDDFVRLRSDPEAEI